MISQTFKMILLSMLILIDLDLPGWTAHTGCFKMHQPAAKHRERSFMWKCPSVLKGGAFAMGQQFVSHSQNLKHSLYFRDDRQKSKSIIGSLSASSMIKLGEDIRDAREPIQQQPLQKAKRYFILKSTLFFPSQNVSKIISKDAHASLPQGISKNSLSWIKVNNSFLQKQGPVTFTHNNQQPFSSESYLPVKNNRKKRSPDDITSYTLSDQKNAKRTKNYANKLWTTESGLQYTSNESRPNLVTETQPSNLTSKTNLMMAVFDKMQLAMVSVGLFANIITVTTLVQNGQIFQPSILILLRHQSGIDAWICCIGIAMLVQPFMWSTGIYYVDFLVCHIWHGQATYWSSVFVSIWNLVLISYERYLAVCVPFKHNNLTENKVRGIIALIYLGALISLSPAFVQVRMEEGKCVSEFAVPGKTGQIFFYCYSIFSFFILYAIPCILFFVFYGLVIFTFHRRQSQGQFASSRVIDKATTELTKTAVVVTAIFILAIGYDLWYYVLGYTGVVIYKKNTFIQKVGVLLASFNSVCNPFVYALLMPAYRKSIKKTFCSHKANQSGSQASDQSISVSTISSH